MKKMFEDTNSRSVKRLENPNKEQNPKYYKGIRHQRTKLSKIKQTIHISCGKI